MRAGNRARDQVQLGMFGDVLATTALFVENGHVLDLVTRRLLADVTDRCADIWGRKDSGIWELGAGAGRALHHVQNGLLDCVGPGGNAGRAGQIDTRHAGRWARERNHIRDWIDAHCWSEVKQSYTMYPGTDRLDAALLLATRFSFARQDRLALTRDAVVRELSRGALVYRYSGIAKEEGTFLACAFWLVDAYALLGEHDAAVRQMDGLLTVCNANLGLLHEQMDPDSGAMLGNMPQALSHLALIHAAIAIAEGKD